MDEPKKLTPIPALQASQKKDSQAKTTPAQDGSQPDDGMPAKTAAKPTKKSSNKKQVIIIVFVVFAVILFIASLIIPSVINKPQEKAPPKPPNILNPTPTLIPGITRTEDPLVGEPDPNYANDPQILQLEATVLRIQRQIDTVDLVEQDLESPEIVTGIKF
jgi:hypothetical protein